MSRNSKRDSLLGRSEPRNIPQLGGHVPATKCILYTSIHIGLNNITNQRSFGVIKPYNRSIHDNKLPVRILALETSGTTGSIALLEDDQLHSEVALGGSQRTAQSLAPTLQAILRESCWEPSSIELICVTSGPGSFTGLRSGVTCAKVFAYATGATVVALNTLEVIAANAEGRCERLWAVMDAQRQQLFAAAFNANGEGPPQVTRETKILDNTVWLDQLAKGNCVTGTGLTKLLNRLPPHVEVVPEVCWAPTASTLGALGLAKFNRGEVDDFWKLAPQYFRKSAAEEKFDQGLLK